MNRANAVAVVALPPPVTGQSMCSRLAIETAGTAWGDVTVVDLTPTSAAAAARGWRGVVERAVALVRVWVQLLRARPERLYLQLGQSVGAVLRDVVIVAVACRANVIVGHVHGSGLGPTLRRHPIIRALYRRCVGRRLSSGVVLSQGLIEQFAETVPADRVRVVPNSLSPDLHEALSEPTVAQQRVARVHALTTGEVSPRLLFLSNLLPSKGYGTAIKAFRRVLDLYPAASLSIVGRPLDRLAPSAGELGPDLVKCGALTVRHGVAREELPELLLEHDVLVFPTRYPVEGVPLVVLEALAAGMWVVVSPLPGLKELGQEFALRRVSPTDYGAVADALISVLRAPDARAIEVSRRQAMADFRPVRHMKELGEVLSDAREGLP